jgi:phage tail sheath protein FI
LFVCSDGAAMARDGIDNGRLVCLVGIAPVRPVKFVSVRISQRRIEAHTWVG